MNPGSGTDDILTHMTFGLGEYLNDNYNIESVNHAKQWTCNNINVNWYFLMEPSRQSHAIELNLFMWRNTRWHQWKCGYKHLSAAIIGTTSAWVARVQTLSRVGLACHTGPRIPGVGTAESEHVYECSCETLTFIVFFIIFWHWLYFHCFYFLFNIS